jgi:hypothetical protein
MGIGGTVCRQGIDMQLQKRINPISMTAIYVIADLFYYVAQQSSEEEEERGVLAES